MAPETGVRLAGLRLVEVIVERDAGRFVLVGELARQGADLATVGAVAESVCAARPVAG